MQKSMVKKQRRTKQKALQHGLREETTHYVPSVLAVIAMAQNEADNSTFNLTRVLEAK